jgi:hypothetical protein
MSRIKAKDVEDKGKDEGLRIVFDVILAILAFILDIL